MKLNLNPLIMAIREKPKNFIRFTNQESYTVTDPDIKNYPGCIRLCIEPARPKLSLKTDYAFSLKGLK